MEVKEVLEVASIDTSASLAGEVAVPSPTKIDPSAVVRLADSIEGHAPDLEMLGATFSRAAQPVNTGPDELDAQTRSAVGTVRSALEAYARALEAVTDALDRTVTMYIATNDQATAEQRELLERLRAAERPTS